jgi:hypothetical protein
MRCREQALMLGANYRATTPMWAAKSFVSATIVVSISAAAANSKPSFALFW